VSQNMVNLASTSVWRSGDDFGQAVQSHIDTLSCEACIIQC